MSIVGQAVFRADASVAIGGGHVMRCLSLAETLASAGWHCAFACRRQTVAQMPIVNNGRLDVLEFDQGDVETEIIRRRWPEGPDLIVVDHYDLDADFERGCRGWADRILVIDDLANRPHDADFLLDQTHDRRADDYGDFVPAHCRLLLGAEYALLRPEFPLARENALARRRDRPPLRRIMVAVGSSDPTHFTAVALEGVARSGLDVEVEVVLGSSAPHLGEVREQCARLPLPATFHVNVGAGELAEIMGRADVAIGSGGTTSWERCCLGLPALVVVTAENQRLVVENLAHVGAVELLGEASEVAPDRLAAALRSIEKDAERRYLMGLKASEVCDGRGAERVVQVLTAGDR